MKNYRFKEDKLQVLCSICKVWKPEDQMAPDKHASYGKDTRCIPCKKETSKEEDAKSQQWKSLREWFLRYTSLYVFLKDNIRHISIKSRSENYNKHLGCSPKQAWDYVYEKRESWMTLDNYGGDNDGTWNIDHHVPYEMAKSCREMFKIAHYTNLRPMRSNDNRKREDIPEEKIKQLLGRESHQDPIEANKDPEDLKQIISQFSNADKFILTVNTRFTTDTDFYSDRITAALYKANMTKHLFLDNLPTNPTDQKTYKANIKNQVIENLKLGKRIPYNNQLKLF